MDFKAFSERYASEIGGEYRDYDESSSVIIVPLKDGRFQTVTGHVTHNTDYDRQMVQLKTKVCKVSQEIPFPELLAESAEYPYSKFIVEDDFLKVEAIAFLDGASEATVKKCLWKLPNMPMIGNLESLEKTFINTFAIQADSSL